MSDGTLNIDVNDIIIETDETNGTTMGHVIDITPNWLTIHWLTGVNSNMPGGIWACPISEAHKAVESGEWEILSESERFNVETR